MSNLEIKREIKKANLKHWQVAEMLGISEYTLSRRMRKELSDEMKQKIMGVIKNGK